MGKQSAAPVSGRIPLLPPPYIINPQQVLTAAQNKAVTQRLTYLNIEKYDPNSTLNNIKKFFTGFLDNPELRFR